jgi:TolB-like protein/class 3 adenylate cyclase
VSETRKLAAILAADVAAYSRLAGVDEEGIVARLRAVRHELIDPVVAANKGRIVKTTGDGRLIEFGSVVDAVRCAIEVQRKIAVRNADIAPEKRIEFRVGIHLGDVIVESDGDLMGDGVNVAARLEGICEPNGICLSNAAYEQVRDKITADFVDLGEHSLKNIARPVRAYAIPAFSQSGRTMASRGGAREPVKEGPPRLSIVVLPFANIGGDPEQGYFADGVTESLTTDLSRMAGSFVIGRNTAFTYKSKAVDLKQIGRDLNVRYVLEGSVQRAGNRLRVNVQLIEAESGTHLWAERFDKPVADLFDMQDEIVSRLARQLDAELIAAEARRAEHSPNPDSMDLYFEGMACFNKGPNPEHLRQARAFFERTLALDPNNVDATVGHALEEIVVINSGALPLDERAVRLGAVEAAINGVLSRTPNHALAHRALGSIYAHTRRADQGIVEVEHALTLDRNLAPAHGIVGLAKIHLGCAAETEGHVRDALRISPRDTLAFHWMTIAGNANLFLGRHEEAVDWLRRSIDANRNYPTAPLLLAAALAHLGRLDEARAAARDALAMLPDLTLKRLRDQALQALGGDSVAFAQAERAFEGMRKVGVLPEG